MHACTSIGRKLSYRFCCCKVRCLLVPSPFLRFLSHVVSTWGQHRGPIAGPKSLLTSCRCAKYPRDSVLTCMHEILSLTPPSLPLCVYVRARDCLCLHSCLFFVKYVFMHGARVPAEKHFMRNAFYYSDVFT